jgi:hypothetical protein
MSGPHDRTIQQMVSINETLRSQVKVSNKQRGEQGKTIHQLRLEVEHLKTLKDKEDHGNTHITINVDPNSDDILKMYSVEELDILHNYIGIGTYWLNSIRRKELVAKKEVVTITKDYPTESQVDAAITVLRKYMTMPYGARVTDYMRENAKGMELADGLAKLQEADRESERRNRHIVAKALKAAMGVEEE